MHSLHRFAIAASLFASAAAMAQEGTQDFKDVTLSSRARAEVLAELASARTQGQLDQRGEAYGSFDARAILSTRPRAEVVAELNAARAAGQLEHRGETYGSFDARGFASARTRADVAAELREATRTGRRLSQGERS